MIRHLRPLELRKQPLFQLESSGMRDLLTGLKPDRFEDIIAIIALYRPGPMDLIPDFIKRKQGKVPITYELPDLEPLLKDTYGVIVYQEQVMAIANKMAGFSLGQADILRRAMGKKKPEEMEKLRVKFLEGAKQKKVPEKKAEKLYELIQKFAGYGFNKSHAAAYAVVCYQTAHSAPTTRPSSWPPSRRPTWAIRTSWWYPNAGSGHQSLGT